VWSHPSGGGGKLTTWIRDVSDTQVSAQKRGANLGHHAGKNSEIWGVPPSP
jgi:hypothetical protein